MTAKEFVEKYGDELAGLLLQSFALDYQWREETPVAFASRGLAMKKQMVRGRALLERIYHELSHKEKASDQATVPNGQPPNGKPAGQASPQANGGRPGPAARPQA